MKKFFRYLGQDKITYWSIVSAIFFLLASFFLIVFFYRSLPPFLPIYNKLPWGYARAGYKLEIFIYLGIGIIFLGGNLILSSILYKKVALLARFLCITSAILWLFILIFAIQTILLIR